MIQAAVAGLARAFIAAATASHVSDTYTTFVSANYTPTADGTTATTLTFTAKDANDTAISGQSVTYA